MNLKLGGYELEAVWSGSGLGSYYSKLEMSALLLCAVLKNSYFRHCWKMVAVDILTVPISTNGNKYQLVIQDYFTKWATAIPLPTITSALINPFFQMGMPEAVHSDQGRNFESTILKQL